MEIIMAPLRVTVCLVALAPLVSGFHIGALGSASSGVRTTTASTSSRNAALSPVVMAAGKNNQGSDGAVTRTGALQRAAAAVLGAGLAFPSVVAVAPLEAQARKAGVDRPDLLPKEQTNVIDLVSMLTKGQAKRINKQLEDLEKATGYRLRLLCQKYPETPGLAVKDYWKVDDKTIVMVVDAGEDDRKSGAVNILNFNVGDGLRLGLPPQFWQRLQNKYGNRFYVRDNGPDGAIMSAVDSITVCLRSDTGFCVDPPDLKKMANDQAMLQGIGRR
ncbi:unnamed protein product [Pylaiella littoralis]